MELGEQFLTPDRNETKNIIGGDTDSIFVYIEHFLNQHIIKLGKTVETTTKKEKIEIVNDYVNKAIDDEININVIPEFVKLFGIDLDYNKLYFKSEILAQRGYFLDKKKRYGMKIISVEGKEKDDYDVKGIEIVRSETSEFAKDLLKELLYKIILDDGASITAIIEYCENKREEYIEKLLVERSTECCTTISFSKDLSAYKTLTGHIKAFMLANALIGREEFMVGSKSYLLYIKGIDDDKAPPEVKQRFYSYKGETKSIAISRSSDTFPEWLMPNLDKMLDLNFTKRITNLLSPLDVKIDKGGTTKENLELEF